MSKFVFRSKTGFVSFQIHKRTNITIAALFLVTLLLFLLSLSVGSSWISPFKVMQQLVGSTDEYDFVINTLRLPRVILSFLVGAALGVSGLILQGIVRNPLASPDIIGITGGASVGAILFIVLFAGQVSITLLPIAAIVGAAIVSIIVYLLSWKNGVTPIRLILIGIGIAAAMSALTTMMIVLSDITTAGKAYLWLTGSIYGANWSSIYGMLPWVVVLVPVVIFFARTMNAKELGDDVAKGLGVNVQLNRFVLLFISVALAGAAVAFAGGIGFVGLIAPHIARKLIGLSFAALVPTAAFIGGIIVMVADVVGRTVFLPSDIPAGVFTAGIGAPFFIYLLFKNRNL